MAENLEAGAALAREKAAKERLKIACDLYDAATGGTLRAPTQHGRRVAILTLGAIVVDVPHETRFVELLERALRAFADLDLHARAVLCEVGLGERAPAVARERDHDAISRGIADLLERGAA